ncbi:hypothetical protein [Enterobacter kobei]|uniref:hypothetical protein n=1 Tax=Enterobacter kobei TaxID=208224 RepID=UPI00388D3C79
MGIASSYKRIHFLEGVIMVVLTERVFRFSLFISQLLAKAIPVRGAKFEKPAFKQAFCFSASGKIVGWRLRLTYRS